MNVSGYVWRAYQTLSALKYLLRANYLSVGEMSDLREPSFSTTVIMIIVIKKRRNGFSRECQWLCMKGISDTFGTKVPPTTPSYLNQKRSEQFKEIFHSCRHD